MKQEIECAVDGLLEQNIDQVDWSGSEPKPPLSFEEWKLAVDNQLHLKVGLESDDIPDWRYYDDYDNDLSPEESADRAIAYGCELLGIDPEELMR